MLEKIIGILKNNFKKLADVRRGKNKMYEIGDIVMAAYSIFHMQSSSFLAHQQRLANMHATHNGESLFGFSKIPSDNHIRSILDEIETKELSSIFNELHGQIDQKEFQAEGGLIVAIDGVYFFSSEKIHCKCCLKKDHNGKIKNYHSMLVPALIHPEQKCALPMLPEFIDQNDGVEKQDCETNSAKRWVDKNANWLIEKNVTLLGDDLFSRSPFIKKIIELSNVRFIFVAKPNSHKYLNEQINACTNYEVRKVTEKKGSKNLIYNYKIFNNISLTSDMDSPNVNYFEMIVTNTKGDIVYQNNFVTNHKITVDNIHKIARLGRDRWKIENEAFNILKTKGYNLEHNFGHGKKNLANVIACLNLIAFLVHYLSEQLCDKYKKLRECFGARVRFFQTLSVMLSAQIFNSWEEFLDFMIPRFTPINQRRRSK